MEKEQVRELIGKYKMVVGNLVYDSESKQIHENVGKILEEMIKDQNTL